MKKILITGANSYIGNSVQAWLEKEPKNYQVTTIDMKTDEWKEKDFSPYDVVFHVAGIAHVSTDPNMENLYYKVNRDLTIETAFKAKKEGVRQFIFMSSIIVYGDSKEKDRVITKKTKPIPTNFYGKSKLEAEVGITKIQDKSFVVTILRPPMIYGNGSKGNFPKLSKFSKVTPFFPDYKNKRSMLYIDNLCEFLKITIDYETPGIFFPQNEEYVTTSEMVKEISKYHGRSVLFTKIFNPLISLFMNIDIFNKVFGNLIYEKDMSFLNNQNYQVSNFIESIIKTEKEDKNK